MERRSRILGGIGIVAFMLLIPASLGVLAYVLSGDARLSTLLFVVLLMFPVAGWLLGYLLPDTSMRATSAHDSRDPMVVSLDDDDGSDG